jgi:hypothetical protein
MATSGMLHCVIPERTEVSEELSVSIIKVTRMSEIRIKLDPPKRRFLQEPRDLTSQETPFLMSHFAGKNFQHALKSECDFIPPLPPYASMA